MNEELEARMARRKLGDLLRDADLVSDAELQQALGEQREGERIGSTLLRLRLIDAAMLAKVLAEQQGVRAVDLDSRQPEAEALALVPADTAHRLGCLPVAIVDGALEVAFSDPNDSRTVEEVETVAGTKVVRLVAPQMALFAAIKRAYGTGPAPRLPR